MDLFNTSEDRLNALQAFIAVLDFRERKALITLARSQGIPNVNESPILFSKVQPILDKLVRHPPFTSINEELLPVASLVIDLLSSSLTTGLLIVYALGVELPDSEVDKGRIESFNKEFLATQTVRRPEEWFWKGIISPESNRGSVIHPLFPFLSPLQRKFSRSLPRFKSSISGRVILPHYSSRGVSSETAALLQNRVTKFSRGCRGNPRTFHRRLDRSNITSRDVIHHYIRTGEWIFGRTEMKQRWYPSGLLPRTYFAWGGIAIAASSYLRQFFNDLGDIFAPTHRRNRVQPDWLHTDSDSHKGYLFYDLTSFTSWFHEQHSFITSLAESFSDVSVFLVGEDLSLSQHTVRDLLLGYCEYVNDYPEFIISKSISKEFGDRSFHHQCAGFLGVVGNLVTCTIAHGLSVANNYLSENDLQVPGDDVGCSYRSEENVRDIGLCASSLGTLQFDKVFRTPQTCIYLKRLVLDLGSSITLAPMLIYPLLPYLINPNDSSKRSTQYRLPSSDRLLPRAASVLVSFHRDLWKMTKGDIDSLSAEIILLLLRTIHKQVGLPFDAIFQGRVYGSGEEDSRHYPHIPVKFPVDEDHILTLNPDAHFASKYVTHMVIRSVVGLEVRTIQEDLKEGEVFVVRNSKGWRFLEDMGYVRLLGIPGEKMTLVGEDAKDAYLFASEPPFTEVEVSSSLDIHQLVAAGVVASPDSVEFGDRRIFSSTGFDVNMQSWRYRKYVDLDDPRSAGIFGRSREWVSEGLQNFRSSLSPEPASDFLDY